MFRLRRPAGPRLPRARLISSCPQTSAFEFTFDQLPVLVGRSPEAGIRLEDHWVSRRHCQIDQVDGNLVVRDLDSKHGTYVNGTRVAEAVLQPGDRLSAGASSFLVSYQRR